MGIAESGRVTDYELARCAASGDAGAFEALYLRHFRRVYGLCLRMTASPHEAEDLTQEVFIHLIKKIGSFRGDSKFTTWLHRVAVNHVLMRLRKGKARREESLEDESAVREVKDPNGHQMIDVVALAEAVARLPRGYRTVFGLHDVEGYNHGEIARMLGVSEGTSKSQLHMARLSLRNLLLRGATRNMLMCAGAAGLMPGRARRSRVVRAAPKGGAGKGTEASISPAGAG